MRGLMLILTMHDAKLIVVDISSNELHSLVGLEKLDRLQKLDASNNKYVMQTHLY